MPAPLATPGHRRRFRWLSPVSDEQVPAGFFAHAVAGVTMEGKGKGKAELFTRRVGPVTVGMCVRSTLGLCTFFGS